jgi:single-strand DNA-binding protein
VAGGHATVELSGRVLSFSVATSEFWKDNSGQQRERTEWHRVSIFVDSLIELAEKSLHKGSKVLVQGKLETRKWTGSDGTERFSTEVALRPFQSNLVLLDAPNGRNEGAPRHEHIPAGAGEGDLNDEVPF